MIARMRLLCLIINIKSEGWPICHCLGLGNCLGLGYCLGLGKKTQWYALYVFL